MLGFRSRTFLPWSFLRKRYQAHNYSAIPVEPVGNMGLEENQNVAVGEVAACVDETEQSQPRRRKKTHGARLRSLLARCLTRQTCVPPHFLFVGFKSCLLRG